jgi:hypothetical protein
MPILIKSNNVISNNECRRMMAMIFQYYKACGIQAAAIMYGDRPAANWTRAVSRWHSSVMAAASGQ